MRTRSFTLLALFLTGMAAGACERPPQPYVYRTSEFDRRNPNFNREIEAPSGVIICYGSWKTTPDQVFALAQAECGKAGNAAVLDRQDYQRCPLATPVAAHYHCTRPATAGGQPVGIAPARLDAAPTTTPGWIIQPFGFPQEPAESSE